MHSSARKEGCSGTCSHFVPYRCASDTGDHQYTYEDCNSRCSGTCYRKAGDTPYFKCSTGGTYKFLNCTENWGVLRLEVLAIQKVICLLNIHQPQIKFALVGNALKISVPVKTIRNV